MMKIRSNKTPEELGPPLPAARLLRGSSLQKLEKKRSEAKRFGPRPRWRSLATLALPKWLGYATAVAGENLAAKWDRKRSIERTLM
jgi:hypothetical protein